MPFPVTSLQDDFNRANGGAGANWQNLNGTLSVTSNQASAAADTLAFLNTITPGPECESFATVPVTPATAGVIAVMARLVDTGSVATLDGYATTVTVSAGTDNFSVQRIDNGVGTTLGSFVSQELASGDGLGIRCTGSTIRAFYKSGAGAYSELFNRTDGTYTAAGRLGLTMTDTTVRVDDFGGGDYYEFEQEGFRFRNDDGSETTATWIQAQDTNASKARSSNVRLRMLMNSTGDAPIVHATLRYRPVGDDTWIDLTP